MDKSGLRIHITGIVQGVGFRPFVYGLATRLALTGWVKNTSAGVDIEVDGEPGKLDEFVHALEQEKPPLAHIDSLSAEKRAPNGFTRFEIIGSESIEAAFQPISPDVCICPDCLREMFDPHDRRYHYPFINCTNCGPRFTIIADIPYDRPNTTMVGFPLCPDCAREYHDPLDRRFHAQPVACPICGPQVWIEPSPLTPAAKSAASPPPKWGEGSGVRGTAEMITGYSPPPVLGEGPGVRDTAGMITGYSPPPVLGEGSGVRADAALLAAQDLLCAGKIVAVKGLGGFHLACDALNPQAVDELRRRKLRVDKPFALMMPDLETVRKHCHVSEAEATLLESHQRPIVILKRREGSPVAVQVTPGQDTLGVMLPYTPLHYLLFAKSEGEADSGLEALVMTSGNLAEEPIAADNQEARTRLSSLADAFLMHDRPIRTRCDDSVVRVAPVETGAGILPVRRSRGYAPMPVRLPWESPPLLAAGAELKNAFCLTRESYAFLSHHIGDMENYETLASFEDGVQHLQRLFRIRPEAIAYDLHPNYLATRYALERTRREGIPATGVQHHHAHIAACMAENGLDSEATVLGVAFDGTGYGADGAIWGGEFLLAGYRDYERLAHLAYTPLPGGDAAIRKPARTALAHLWQAGIPWEAGLAPVEHLCAEERTTLRAQLEHGINTPPTSSMGRLFDAAAALAGVRQSVNYEAQAAIEFEALANPDESGVYRFEIEDQSAGNPLGISPAPLWASLVEDVLSGVPAGIISARFHNGVAGMVLDVCRRLRETHGVNQVALSGGTWQNVTLLAKSARLLRQDGFEIYTHHSVPPNDGGIALGQAAVAACRIKKWDTDEHGKDGLILVH